MKYFFAFLVIACMVISCTKKAKIKLPPQETKLVLTCFISPGDSIVTAVVRSSTPKFAGYSVYKPAYEDMITNATIVLSNDVKSLTFMYDSAHSVYYAWTKDLAILEGKTYSINASTPDGKKVSANTTVPTGKLEIKTFDVVALRKDSSIIELDSRTTITDISGVTNYVEIAFNHFTSSFGGTGDYDYASRYFDSDENVTKSEYSQSNNDRLYGSGIQHAMVFLSVLNCSKEFYLYNKSVEKASRSGDNPFTDPVLIYTNIENGFGCFGSYVGNYMNKEAQ